MRDFGEAPPPPTFIERLREGLSRSTAGLSDNIAGIFTKTKLDAPQRGAAGRSADQGRHGNGAGREIVAAVGEGRYGAEISDYDVREILRREIAQVLKPIEKPFSVDGTKKPFVILVAGVNGGGKTTTIGKLAKKLTDNGAKVVLAAGDTFRAAAIEQLAVWGKRAGAVVVSRPAGSDAAGLAFEALERARTQDADILIVDTAGRLQNKVGLMAELEKIVRVIRKLDASAPHATLLVLDATTGQNALARSRRSRASCR